MLENIIGAEDAAKILNLSPGTVKNKCAAGELPAKKIGNTWIIDKTLLKEQLKMKQLNYTKIYGRRYKLPEGYYAIEGRVGNQVFNSRNENVTHKIMGDHNKGGHNPNDFIIETDKGVEKLELLD